MGEIKWQAGSKQEVKEMAATGSVPNKLLTLVMIMKNDKILLGMKKRGFGVNRWNGFGGKLQPGESILDAAKRLDCSCLRYFRFIKIQDCNHQRKRISSYHP